MTNLSRQSPTRAFLKRASSGWVVPLLSGAAGGALLLFGLTI